MHSVWIAALRSIQASLHGLPVGEKMAYLDPGSGSYLIQLIIAGLLGSLFVIRASWGRIKSFFRRVFTRKGGETGEEG